MTTSAIREGVKDHGVIAMTETCDCYRHSECHVGCACPKLECEYIFQDAEYEEERYMMREGTMKVYHGSCGCVVIMREEDCDIDPRECRDPVIAINPPITLPPGFGEEYMTLDLKEVVWEEVTPDGD